MVAVFTALTFFHKTLFLARIEINSCEFFRGKDYFSGLNKLVFSSHHVKHWKAVMKKIAFFHFEKNEKHGGKK